MKIKHLLYKENYVSTNVYFSFEGEQQMNLELREKMEQKIQLNNAKIIDWSSAITSLWEIGDICFFDVDSNRGVYIGIEEDRCIVEVVE